MPLYEFQCNECGRESELLVRGNEATNCPSCGSEKMVRLLSIVSTPSKGAASEARPAGGGSCGAGCGCHPH